MLGLKRNFEATIHCQQTKQTVRKKNISFASFPSFTLINRIGNSREFQYHEVHGGMDGDDFADSIVLFCPLFAARAARTHFKKEKVKVQPFNSIK